MPQHKIRLPYLLLGLLVAILMPTQATFAQDDAPPTPELISVDTVVATPLANLRLRSEPDTTSETLAIMPRGEDRSVLGRNETASWLMLQYGDLIGWASAAWLDVSGDLASVPVVDSVTDITQPPNQPPTAVTITTTANLRLRAGPSTSFETLLVVPRGTTLTPTLRNTDSTWVWVMYRGQRGWLSVSFLTIEGDITTVQVDGLDAPSTPDPETTPIPSEPVVYASIGAASLATQPLKAEADHLARLITIVPIESTVIALAKDPTSAWILVQYGDSRGWLESLYVGLSAGSLASLPTATAITTTFTGPDPRHSNGTGYPDVQIMIHWNTTADIDMVVTDPEGNVLSASNRNAPNGGRYEHVVNQGCDVTDSAPVETVSWADGLAPTGTYTVTITYAEECLGSGETLFWISFRNNNFEEFWKWEVLNPGDTHMYRLTR